MNLKYAVYSPLTGENKLYETKELALEAFWNQVIEIAISHCHNTSYMVVEQNEDGIETWYNDNNEEISRPKSFLEKKEMLEAYKLSKSNITPVEVLP